MPVPGPQKEICHGQFGKKWPLSQWISVQFVFSVLTPWNRFQIMSVSLSGSASTWCLKKYIQMLIFILAARNNRYILLTRFSRLFILWTIAP